MKEQEHQTKAVAIIGDAASEFMSFISINNNKKMIDKKTLRSQMQKTLEKLKKNDRRQDLISKKLY